MIKSKKKFAHCRLRTVDLLRLLLTAYCLIAFTTEINPTIRYVSPTGNNILPYLTWENAANSIQDAIDVSEFGDTIYVANGIYEEQVVMINGLALIGAGIDSCIIDTRDLITSTGNISVVVSDSCLLKGFNVKVYYNPSMGYGISIGGNDSSLAVFNRITNAAFGVYAGYAGSQALIHNNIIENVQIGVELFNSNATIRKNTISIPNISGAQGIHIEAFNNTYTPIIDSNYIETYREGIRKSFGTKPTINNNTIILKLVGATGMYLGGTPESSGKIYNNLIIADPLGANGIQNYIENSKLFNNYMSRNIRYGLTMENLSWDQDTVKHNVVTNTERGVQITGTENLVFQYNNLWNNEINYSGFTPDSTNLSVDPMVINDDTTQGELDFHLQKYSPLIDAGDPEMIDKDSSRIDVGLYGGIYGEVYKYQDLQPKPPRNLIGIVDSATITISWNQNTEADFSYYKLFRDTTVGFTADSTTLVMSLTDTFYTHIIPPDVESFYYKLTATDNQGNESGLSEELAVSVTSVNTVEPTIVSNYILYQNYPNPFNPSTTIAYKLKERGYVKLYVYSVSGELVSTLVNQTQEAGYYEIEFSASGIRNQESGIRDLASGVYICQIMVKNENNIPVFTDMKKMVLIK